MSAPLLDPLQAETLSFAALPKLRSELRGGLFFGIATRKDGTHVAVILLPDTTQSRQMLTWDDAMSWARSTGGELPTQPVTALLCANAGDQFEGDVHWTGDDFDGDGRGALPGAWLCDFFHGFADTSLKEFEALARAVRLIPLTA